jgi:Spy/CpxP family protein refolding chaperone
VFVIPSQIAKDLVELTQTNRKGVEALYEAETDLAQAEADLDKRESQEFLGASGSVAERQARAKLECADIRFDRDLAKARVNRIRTKMRSIESELMALATAAKILQAEMKL